jgi:hypothetical protein
MKRTEHLVRQIRRQTDNVQFGEDDGITTEELIQYINDAQRNLQAAIIRTHKNAFVEIAYEDSVSGQDEYSLPSAAWLGSGLILVEYSDTGQEKDFRPLDKVEYIENRKSEGTPIQYAVRKNRVALDPIPRSNITGGIRIIYNQRVPDVDIRRSKVTTATLNGAGTEMTALTLDFTYSAWDDAAWADEDDFLCIVDEAGTIKMASIAYTAINPTTGVVTLAGNHVLQPGESISAGDYVVRGLWASTHSHLPDEAETYLIKYANWEAYSRDSSDDQAPASEKMAMIRKQIIDSYETYNDDIHQIPIINYEYY